MIHHITPYRLDKDLGAAYNEAFRYVGPNDWICFGVDIDFSNRVKAIGGGYIHLFGQDSETIDFKSFDFK